MKYLKADHEIDTIGGPNRSLLEGSNKNKLSEETVAQVEATRKKLAGISIVQEHDPAKSRLEPKPKTCSNEEPQSSQSTDALSSQPLSQALELEAKSLVTASETTASFHIAAFALPTNAIMQHSKISIQSFHSALSHLDPAAEDRHVPSWESAGCRETDSVTHQGGGDVHRKIDTENINLHLRLKADCVASAIKHYQMSEEDAVTRISLPSLSESISQQRAAAGRQTKIRECYKLTQGQGGESIANNYDPGDMGPNAMLGGPTQANTGGTTICRIIGCSLIYLKSKKRKG